MKTNITSYKDLIVWQRAMQLALAVYELTERFPQEERYGLTSQMRRASISIPSNIAEGKMRGTRKDYRSFLIIAFGSGAELETQVELAKILPFGHKLHFEGVDTTLQEVMKMLNTLTKNLKTYNLTPKT